MSPQPELQAREQIDALLGQVGWHVCDSDKANINGARSAATHEFPLKPGHVEADFFNPNLVMKRWEIREVESQVDAHLKRAERLRQSVLSKAFSCELEKEIGRELNVARG